jgi:tetratricopeptide (TPR) repeat protein
MKKMTFTALGLSLMIAAGVQRASRPKAESVGKGEKMASSDANLQVVEPMALDWDPCDFSDEDAIKRSRSFVGTPWLSLESREGLVLSVDTAEGQLYLACLYARSSILMSSQTVGFFRHATKEVECCQKALALKPGYPEAYIVLSEGLLVMQRFKEAEAALESAIALRPDWASAYCALANVLVAQDRYSDALPASQQEVHLTTQAASRGVDTGYRGPRSIHSNKNDTLRLDHIQFKIEHPNDFWDANERIRALGLDQRPSGVAKPKQ